MNRKEFVENVEYYTEQVSNATKDDLIISIKRNKKLLKVNDDDMELDDDDLYLSEDSIYKSKANSSDDSINKSFNKSSSLNDLNKSKDDSNKGSFLGNMFGKLTFSLNSNNVPIEDIPPPPPTKKVVQKRKSIINNKSPNRLIATKKLEQAKKVLRKRDEKLNYKDVSTEESF